MANTKINGIVLTETNFGDYDKMLTILTPNHGKISCVAKGARRPRSTLLAGTQMFAFAEYLVFKGGNAYNINSVDVIEVFYNLRIDLDKLNYAVKINKIVNEVVQENQNSFYILQLLLNTLYIISESDKNLELIYNIFKLRILVILGFKPEVGKCKNCEEQENMSYFSIRDNGMKCEACSKVDKSAIFMSESTKNAIKYTVTAPPKKLFNFDIKGDSLEEFKLIVKLFFREKLELNIDD